MTVSLRRGAVRAIWLIGLQIAFSIGALQAALADPVLPMRTGAITDEADIFPDGYESDLADRARQVMEKTGTELVVVTLLSLQRQPIEAWGRTLGNTWQIGGSRADGVILIVAPYDQQVRIEIGDGASSKLTSSVADSIIQDMILPKFRDGNLAGGTASGFFAIIDALEPGIFSAPRSAPVLPAVEPVQSPATRTPADLPSWAKPQVVGFVVVVAVFVGLMLLYAVYRRMRDLFSGKASLERELLLDQEVKGTQDTVYRHSVIRHSRGGRHTGIKFGGLRSGSSGSGGRGSSGKW